MKSQEIIKGIEYRIEMLESAIKVYSSLKQHELKKLGHVPVDTEARLDELQTLLAYIKGKK